MPRDSFPSRLALRTLVVFALAGWPALAGAQAINPATLCGCVTQVKQAAAEQIEAARAQGTVIVDVDGNLAVAGQRVRIGSPWSYDPGRNACVGSYEYWQQSGAEWRLVDRVPNVVDLDQAAASCRSLGATSGPTISTPPATVPPKIVPCGSMNRTTTTYCGSCAGNMAANVALYDRPSYRA